MVSIHLLADERKRIYRSEENDENNVKGMERLETFRLWQREWNTGTTGKWTHRLIGNVKRWSGRQHGEINYFTTQALSGHGSFSDYLVKIKKREICLCLYCQEEDSPLHAIFRCHRWTAWRNEMTIAMGQEITPDNIIELALDSKRSWEIIMGTITKIMKKKEEDMKNSMW